MARPKKKPGAFRTFRLEIRLTQSEQTALFLKATESGLSMSDYVRLTVLNVPPIQKKAEPERAALIKILGQLGKIGGNVNQIAHELHRERITGQGRIVKDETITAALDGVKVLSDHLINKLSSGH